MHANVLNPVRIKAPGLPGLEVSLARSMADLHACQRLRYQIFAREMGASLNPSSMLTGLDADELDSFCQHLMVRDLRCGEVVACTRILLDAKARSAGGFYSQTEFDLGPILQLGGRFMEIGRTCVHPEYRSGSAISQLWMGLAQVMAAHEVDYLIGCASIPMAPDQGAHVQAIMQRLREKHLVPEELRVQPLRPLPTLEDVPLPEKLAMPPLLKAYLRLGAYIGGEPCWDPDFGVADVFILVDRHFLPDRYQRHFLRPRKE